MYSIKLLPISLVLTILEWFCIRLCDTIMFILQIFSLSTIPYMCHYHIFRLFYVKLTHTWFFRNCNTWLTSLWLFMFYLLYSRRLLTEPFALLLTLLLLKQKLLCIIFKYCHIFKTNQKWDDLFLWSLKRLRNTTLTLFLISHILS